MIIAWLILLKFASKFDLAFYYPFVRQNVSLTFSDLRLLVLFHSWAPGCAPLDSLACCYHQGALSMRVSRKGQVVSALEADWLELTAAYYRKGWSLVDSFIYWDTPKGSSLTYFWLSFEWFLELVVHLAAVFVFLWLQKKDVNILFSSSLHFLQVHLFILRSYVLHPHLFKPATSLCL